MEEQVRKEIDALLAYIHRSDARIMAIEMTLGEVFKYNPEHKEAFYKNFESNFQLIHKNMLNKMRDRDPIAFSRVYGDGSNL